ncbi:MAG: PEP-CTERM sorting domain-containing protein [Verrucomicrobiota bacterium]
MKKKASLCLLVSIMSMATSLAATVNFGNYNDYIYTRDGGNTKVESSDNWVYAMYWDSGNDGAGSWGATDDVFLYSNNDWDSSYDGIMLFNSVSDSRVANGSNYFVRVYNSSDWTTSDVGSATHYVNLDMFEDDDGTTYENYDATRTYEGSDTTPDSWAGPGGDAIGGSNPDGSDWQVIPEPSTFMLLGLGLATVLARRKLRK